jgi:hypothetical protein
VGAAVSPERPFSALRVLGGFVRFPPIADIGSSAVQSTETRTRRFPTMPQNVHSSARHSLANWPMVVVDFSSLGILASGIGSTSPQALQDRETLTSSAIASATLNLSNRPRRASLRSMGGPRPLWSSARLARSYPAFQHLLAQLVSEISDVRCVGWHSRTSVSRNDSQVKEVCDPTFDAIGLLACCLLLAFHKSTKNPLWKVIRLANVYRRSRIAALVRIARVSD